MNYGLVHSDHNHISLPLGDIQLTMPMGNGDNAVKHALRKKNMKFNSGNSLCHLIGGRKFRRAKMAKFFLP
jgi:hypothetical protein